MRVTATQLRERSAELREIVHSWDPIGVLKDQDWPRDESDCLVGPILRRLESGVATYDLETFLHDELMAHFGLRLPRQLTLSNR